MRSAVSTLLVLSCFASMALAFLVPQLSRPSFNIIQESARSGHQSRVVVYMGRRAAKIAARKGKSDMAKTKMLAGFGKKIIMAVKAGGPDPESNRALNTLLKEAKSSGVPNENINRAIARGSSANEADFKEAVYEAYGYGGTGIIINCLTDNTNRAKTEIGTAIKKSEVKLANSGSVSFNFDRKGQVEVGSVVDEESIIELAIESDIDDVDVKVDAEESTSYILTDATMAGVLRDALLAKGYDCKSTSIVNIPKLTVPCGDEDFENNMKVIEALEALDDVDSVEHNMALDDDE